MDGIEGPRLKSMRIKKVAIGPVVGTDPLLGWNQGDFDFCIEKFFGPFLEIEFIM